jgi:hypothetical protein
MGQEFDECLTSSRREVSDPRGVCEDAIPQQTLGGSNAAPHFFAWDREPTDWDRVVPARRDTLELSSRVVLEAVDDRPEPWLKSAGVFRLPLDTGDRMPVAAPMASLSPLLTGLGVVARTIAKHFHPARPSTARGSRTRAGQRTGKSK